MKALVAQELTGPAGLPPRVPQRFPLAAGRAALQALAAGEVFGKVVLEP